MCAQAVIHQIFKIIIFRNEKIFYEGTWWAWKMAYCLIFSSDRLIKKDQFKKMGFILYSEGQQLGAVLYLISQSVMLLKVQDRTEWTTGMLWLHKQGWIAWQMAQSMHNGNSISCDQSSTKCGGKVHTLSTSWKVTFSFVHAIHY